MSANPKASDPKSGAGGSPEQLAIDTIRTLSMDAVLKAHSGHVGAPLGLAPVAYTLWTEFMRYDPGRPDWPNRDRFVLSVGHGSMLLYSVLHLAGVEEIDAKGNKTGKPAVSLEDIEQFRQLSSKTPGHPEYRMTTGVETTTGPLGQGCGNSVGMAIAERWLAARYNKPEAKLFDHDVIVLCGDGDMMEGVSSEAASLAGHLKLSNLLWIYDNNKVSIEGFTSLAFSRTSRDASRATAGRRSMSPTPTTSLPSARRWRRSARPTTGRRSSSSIASSATASRSSRARPPRTARPSTPKT